MPAATGTFATFGGLSLASIPSDPIRVAFTATAGTGGQGIYTASLNPTAPAPVRIADTTTAVPAATGTFSSFAAVSMAANVAIPVDPIRVAFVAAGSTGGQGVYTSSLPAGIPTNPIRIANTATPAPAPSPASAR